MIREIHVAPEFCLVLVLPLSDLETLGTSLIFFGQAKILSSFKILCFSICFISKPARHETNLYSSAIAQLSRQLLHMAIPLLILNLQVPTECGLVFLINHTHFWITCYKPIFIFFFSSFSSPGKFMLVSGICRRTPRRPASKKFICFSHLPPPSTNYSYLLLKVLLSLPLTPYALPSKMGYLWCNFPFQLSFYFHNFSTCLISLPNLTAFLSGCSSALPQPSLPTLIMLWKP